MISIKLNHQINFYLTSLLAFFTPIYSKVLPVFIVLLVINWLINPTNIKLSLKNLKSNYVLLASIALYLLYVIGMSYSSNLSFGAKVLETKLSLLILPLIYAAYINLTREKINTYLKLFVYGCITYALICLSYATYAYYKPLYIDLLNGFSFNFGANYFFYSYLSLFFHPSYTAMYSVFALSIIVISIQKKHIIVNLKIVLSIIVLTVFILLLSSKAGWVGLFLLGFYSIIILIIRKKWIQIFYFTIPITILFLVFNVYYTPNVSQRLPQVENIKKAITEKDENNTKVTTSADGNASRIFIWKASYDLFLENFLLGTGTGDSKEKLLEKYLEREMTTEYNNQLNSHNQYLTTSISLGIVGLLIFLFGLLYTFIKALKRQKLIIASFIVLISINFLFESMFETQAGLVFYAFINTMLGCTLLYKRDLRLSMFS